MMTREQLAALKVGDRIVIEGMGLTRTEAAVYLITRASKTKVECAVGAFSRTTGRRVGASTWDAWQLSPHTPEAEARIRAQNMKARQVRELKDIDWASLGTDVLDAVLALVR